MAEQRVIKTRLRQKEEWFKMIAVAEALRLPILLIGKPGTGKTNTLLDYAAAKYATAEEAHEKCFVIEVDEGTKSAEIKGRMDLEAIVTEHKYAVIAPIVDAKFVLINEVDKASSGFRNSMLGCMNEKELMTGHKRIPLDWDVWCASCNTIPEDEKENPFWDRFILKVEVPRLSKAELHKMLDKTPSLHTDTQALNKVHVVVPDQADIDKISVDSKMLEKFINHTHQHVSDRTMTFVPNLVRAVQIVYSLGQASAFTKVCGMLAGVNVAKALSAEIEPKDLIAVRQQIEKFASIADVSVVEREYEACKQTIKSLLAKNIIDKETQEALVRELADKLRSNAFLEIELTIPGEEGSNA